MVFSFPECVAIIHQHQFSLAQIFRQTISDTEGVTWDYCLELVFFIKECVELLEILFPDWVAVFLYSSLKVILEFSPWSLSVLSNSLIASFLHKFTWANIALIKNFTFLGELLGAYSPLHQV